MGYMTINNRKVEFTDEKNILTVIRKAGNRSAYLLLPFGAFHIRRLPHVRSRR